MDEYFKLLCWVFCVWDALILIIIILAFIAVMRILKELRMINTRHKKEIELQESISTTLYDLLLLIEELK